MNQTHAKPTSRKDAGIARLTAYLGLAITLGGMISLASNPYADFTHKGHLAVWAGMLVFVPAACFAVLRRMGIRPWLVVIIGFLLPLICWPKYFQVRFPEPDRHQAYDYWILESIEYLPIKRWAARRSHHANSGALVMGRYIAQDARKIPVGADGKPVSEYSSQQVSRQIWNCPTWNVTYFGPFVITYRHWTERFFPEGDYIEDLTGCTRGK
ncbi:hypothetical protein D3C86_1132170 [compost metagenome]|jgi:hypothetical protein